MKPFEKLFKKEDMQKGILIGSDHNTEWLLPWWWKYYSKYNKFPIAIADFGMTHKMIQWCQKRASVITYNNTNFTPNNDLPKNQMDQWQGIYKGDLLQARKAWFKKPFACLKAPFDLNLWIDIDCEICGPLNPIFDSLAKESELAIVKEETGNYNSGVLLFRKKAPFLQKWADLCTRQSNKYMGDQNALTELILEKKIQVKELDARYNWLMSKGYIDSIVIAHWCAWGKEHIRQFGGLHDLLAKKI